MAAGRLAAVAPLGISDPPVGMEADVEEPRAQRAKARRLATEEAELSPREPSIQEPGTEEPGTESPGAEGPGAVHCTDGAAEKLRSLRDLDGEAKIDEGANSRRTESAATSGRTVDAAAAKRALDGFRVGRELPRGTIVFISVAPERVNKVPNFNKKQGVLTEVQPDGNHKVVRAEIAIH